MSDVRLDATSNGTVYFVSDVLATIAGLAVTEVEGVANTVSGNGSFVDMFARKAQSNSKNLTRGIKVDVVGNDVTVNVTIIVDYGSPVPEVASSIQENVKKAIETMTGMNVKSVDVHVQGVSLERENRAVAELEMTQRKLLEKQPASPAIEQAQEKKEENAEDEDEFVLELEDVEDEIEENKKTENASEE
ncbi:MAG: Asp23/Gls24 family envelope stress response protein [Clostridia bacterium]|nr:Asp23/Gls24 family envelope stress response protein [Clostridia bacterium]